MKTLIQFRLRQLLDADLIAVEIPDEELPDLCRDGLRLMLGIRTTRTVEVKERPLNVPAATPPRAAGNPPTGSPVPGKPAVFVPQNKRRS